jgi:thymidylate synthase (FAD)
MHTAELVWITPNAESLIAKIARVSNPNNENNPKYEKLIKYLIDHKHWSPFEMASMCVEIKTTRAIAAQILRHRSFSFQEFSQRYSEAIDAAVPQLRRQDKKNRQNSIDDLDIGLKMDFQERIDNLFDDSFDLYNDMLSHGVAKECARSVLPLATETRLYMSGTIRSWLHYVDLRADDDTQLEHRAIASSIGEILASEVQSVARAMWS